MNGSAWQTSRYQRLSSIQALDSTTMAPTMPAGRASGEYMDGSEVFDLARYSAEPMYPAPSGRVPSKRWMWESMTGMELIHAGWFAANACMPGIAAAVAAVAV